MGWDDEGVGAALEIGSKRVMCWDCACVLRIGGWVSRRPLGIRFWGISFLE